MASPARPSPDKHGPSPAEESPQPALGGPETFISRADAPLEPEERLAKIEAILKLFGLPNLDEFNRQELEAEARKNRNRKRDGAT